MESSAVVAFRALIMLACLVLVPLAAIFGSAFPEVVKSNLVERFWPGHKQQVAQAGGSEAPAFGDRGPLQSAAHEAQATWPPQAPASPHTIRAVGNEAAGDSARATPAQFSAPAESSPPAWPPASGNQSAAAESLGAPPLRSAAAERPVPQGRLASGNPLASRERILPNRTGEQDHTNPGTQQLSHATPQGERPSAYQRMGESDQQTGGRALQTPSAAQATGGQSADFKAAERRLRQYGASYYRLETVGKNGLEYRFYCMMPTAGNPNSPRHFEATDSDPLSAMCRVADEVESWLARQ